MIPPEFPLPPKVLHSALHHNGYITCEDLHFGTCESRFPVCFMRTFKTMSKYYLPIHIIPFLLFKRKLIKQKYPPYEETLKALKSYINSLLFACSSTAIISVVLCYVRRWQHKVNGDIGLPLATLVATPALLFESPGRQREISLFLMTKVMEIVYNLAKRRGVVKGVKGFTVMAFGVAMAVLCYLFQESGSLIHPTYRAVLAQILDGPI